MAAPSAHTIRDLVIDRLASGQYPLGHKLPTARELAAEIGVHRNTVVKAYQALSDLGLVAMKQGRGTFVIAVPEDGNGTALTTQLGDSLAGLIVQARRLGVHEDDLRSMLDRQIVAAYHTSRRGAFVECNMADTDAAIAEIEMLTGVLLRPLLLDKLAHAPAESVKGLAAIFTSLFHVKEVSNQLASVSPRIEVIGLYTLPDELALSEISQIQPSSTVGIVVSTNDGVPRFSNHINTVTNVTTIGQVMPTDEQIYQLACEVDAIVCSRSRAKQVQNLGLPIPTIVLQFHVSHQSAARVVDVMVGAG